MNSELEFDRSLINSNFDSYRLCSDVPWLIESCPIDGDDLQTLKLAQDDYSYVHASMISNINNLYHDPWSSNVYFIANHGFVILANKKDALKLHNVFQIPDYDPINTYASLAFVSFNRVLILQSKRFGNDSIFALELFIISRNHSNDGMETWNRESHFPIGTDLLYSEFNMIQSSHCHMFNTGFSFDGSISFLFGSINKLPENDTSKKFKSCFCTVLFWLTLDKESGDWCIKNYRRLIEDGLKSEWPKYVALDQSDKIIVASEGRMAFFNVIENRTRNSIKIEPKPMEIEEPERTNFINKNEEEEISDLNLELEECDLPDFYNQLLMTIFDGQTGIIFAEYDLCSHQWICSVPSNLGKSLPYFVIRHDVDAFIMELQEDFKIKHIGVFDALGYIQASKTRKRFISFCQDSNQKQWSHAVIADAEENVYVYWKDSLVKSCVNGHHHIVRLEDSIPKQPQIIQGLYCTHDSIKVLTNNRLWSIEFNNESQQ